jgi:hypothetical protein
VTPAEKARKKEGKEEKEYGVGGAGDIVIIAFPLPTIVVI